MESRHLWMALSAGCVWWLWGAVPAVLLVAAVKWAAEEVWR